MAVRRLRAAGPRRARPGRSGFVALACGLYLAAGLSATWPGIEHFGSRFLAGGGNGHGEVVPGDYLQTTYNFWLVGHQLEHGRAPWLDPYSFRPEASPRVNFAAWPFGLPYWPLDAAFGTVVAWNLLVLLSYLAAGLLACAWLRELGLPRAPALAGGLAFAIAPYRAAQSAGHLLGLIAILLPLALWAFERGRRGSPGWFVLSVAAVASIPLSGQVHLALGAIPFYVAYVLVRSRARPALVGVAAAVAAAVGAGLLVRYLSISGSLQSGGRKLSDVGRYSAHWADFVSRHTPHASEKFVFLGWSTPLVAAAGLVLLLAARRYALAALLGLGALVPLLLAVGTHLPLYSALWHALPPLRYPRVPERLVPIACLCLAALVAYAASYARSRIAVPALLVALLLVDLHVELYRGAPADPGNRAYRVLRPRPAGRLLELPVIRPARHYGSVYLYYDMQADRERPEGYSTVAPRAADRIARSLLPLNCGHWGAERTALLEQLGVRYVAFHAAVYEDDPDVPDACVRAGARGLLAHGFRPVGRGGRIVLYESTR